MSGYFHYSVAKSTALRLIFCTQRPEATLPPRYLGSPE